MARQITKYRNTLRHTTQQTTQFEQTIQQRQQEISRLNENLDVTTQRQQEFEQEAERANLELTSLKLLKHQQQWEIVKNQTMAKRFAEISESKFRPSGRHDHLQQELESEAQKFQYLNGLLQQIAEEQPQFQILLDRVVGWE